MATANGQNNAPQQFVRALRRERIFRDRFDPLQNYDGFELYQRFRFDIHWLYGSLSLNYPQPREGGLVHWWNTSLAVLCVLITKYDGIVC